MGRSSETFGKKDVRAKQAKKRKEKQNRRLAKKEQGKTSLDDMIAYVDENGMITSTPPDLTHKKEVKAENIEIGIPKSEIRVNNKIRTGTLNSFDESKGFGFVVDDQSRDSIFVHMNDSADELSRGCRIEFETEKGLKGPRAVRVKVIG